MQKLLLVGFPLPQTFFRPFYPRSPLDQSQLSEADGATSLQVSDDFASLSSLLNLLRKFLILKAVFRVSPVFRGIGRSTALASGTGLVAGAWTWGFSASLLPSGCVSLALRDI